MLAATHALLTPGALAPPTVTLDAVSAGNFNTSNTLSVTVTDSITVASDANYLVVGLLFSSNWWTDPATQYSTFSVSSSVDGALTEVLTAANRPYLGASGQWTGGMSAFQKTSPTPGAHTLTASFTASVGILLSTLQIISLSYKNVASRGTVTTQVPNSASNGALSVSVSSSATGDKAVCFAAFGTNTPSGFSQTQQRLINNNNAGDGDYWLAGDAAGAGSSVAFTTSSSNHIRAGLAFNLVHT